MAFDFPIPGLTGDVDILTHQDPDPDPNTVLEIQDQWMVRAHWWIQGPIVPFMAGTWHVSVIVESMGKAGEKTLKTVDVPFTPPVGNPRHYLVDIPIPSYLTEPDPEKAITEDGVYQLVVVITYTTPGGQVGRMAGFNEGPLLQFYHFEVP
jgi:hypothetical protein